MGQMYERYVWHLRLDKSRLVRARDPEELRRKADELMAQWEKTWKSKQEREQKAAAREFARLAQARNKEQKIDLAETKTAEAVQEIQRLENILAQGIARDPRLQWEQLKSTTDFPRPKPSEPFFPPPSIAEPILPTPPPEPVRPTIPEGPKQPDLSENLPETIRASNLRHRSRKPNPGSCAKEAGGSGSPFLRGSRIME